MFFVYILYSSSLNKYYVGQTQQLEKRLIRHNQGNEKFTKSEWPWTMI
ncbi:MAG: GIY-YIG nuclease family protein [Crocinitomicaceae bacterium]|nr:GIY-YIG nuclease family protein [Crocinitomicaceae bacterium]